jgi:hypothetical protein
MKSAHYFVALLSIISFLLIIESQQLPSPRQFIKEMFDRTDDNGDSV